MHGKPIGYVITDTNSKEYKLTTDTGRTQNLQAFFAQTVLKPTNYPISADFRMYICCLSIACMSSC